MNRLSAVVFLAVFTLVGCHKKSDGPAPVAPSAAVAEPLLAHDVGNPAPPPEGATPLVQPDDETATTLALGPTATSFAALPRGEFNRLAAEQDLPLYWRVDADKDGALDPDELGVTWPGDWSAWLVDGKFTPQFAEAYGLLEVRARAKPADDSPEGKRRAAVLRELRQGRATLIWSDFEYLPVGEREFVRHMLNAAAGVETLFALQSGTAGFVPLLPPHRPSRALFHRNQTPWCTAPATEQDPDCNALPSRPRKLSGLYPEALQRDKEFCAKLDKLPNAAALMGPFTVVRGEPEHLVAVPYEKAWPVQMEAVSNELTAAADALVHEKVSEPALVAYLRAAAKAFIDGSWFAADEAWAKMESRSKWYVRVGPDETYHEPCARKAGFHVSFARVNQDAVAWQQMLEPLKGQLERALATLAGPPYKSAKPNFHLPDFIDIVLNAGDSRTALGATVGQSLPNWGPVADESRGRTVAMANLYTDIDSQAAFRTQVSSLFCKESAPWVPTDPESLVMTTVLHEAAHNLGPAHGYKVGGKVDDEVFGGPLAATLEELKAETAALYFADWLVAQGKLTPEKRDAGQAAGVAWAMGHIAQGMTTPSDKPKPYSQLSATQVGTLYDAKALTWHADTLAANDKDKGCFSLHRERVANAVLGLMTRVAQIKAQGDKAGAEQLLSPYVTEGNPFADLRAIIRERWLRVSKPSFVYAIRLK